MFPARFNMSSLFSRAKQPFPFATQNVRRRNLSNAVPSPTDDVVTIARSYARGNEAKHRGIPKEDVEDQIRHALEHPQHTRKFVMSQDYSQAEHRPISDISIADSKRSAVTIQPVDKRNDSGNPGRAKLLSVGTISSGHSSARLSSMYPQNPPLGQAHNWEAVRKSLNARTSFYYKVLLGIPAFLREAVSKGKKPHGWAGELAQNRAWNDVKHRLSHLAEVANWEYQTTHVSTVPSRHQSNASLVSPGELKPVRSSTQSSSSSFADPEARRVEQQQLTQKLNRKTSREGALKKLEGKDTATKSRPESSDLPAYLRNYQASLHPYALATPLPSPTISRVPVMPRGSIISMGNIIFDKDFYKRQGYNSVLASSFAATKRT
jgi:hypothetical protein